MPTKFIGTCHELIAPPYDRSKQFSRDGGEAVLFQFVALFILAFAVSLDSFGAGITYGMRKVRIPLRSIFIIALCSTGMILIAMGVAQGFLYFLSSHFAEILGGSILIVLGIWALYNMYRSGHNDQEVTKHVGQSHQNKDVVASNDRVWTLELNKLGIVIQILRRPMAADIDRSGRISSVEAFILGLALSLDAFGAGIGAALMGYSPWVTALLIGSMSSLFVYMGMRFGDVFSGTIWLSRLSFIPGFLLITIGLFKVF